MVKSYINKWFQKNRPWNRTDLERLLEVFETENPGRGVGKSFLACQIVAGTIEVIPQGSFILCDIHYDRDMQEFLPMLIGVLEEHDIDILYIDKYRRTLKVKNDITIVFGISRSFYECDHKLRSRLLGIYYSVDFKDYEIYPIHQQTIPNLRKGDKWYDLRGDDDFEFNFI